MNENIEFCARLKNKYYIQNIKMLYNWSRTKERTAIEYLTALGMFEYTEAIKWLLDHKADLNSQININIRALFENQRGTIEYNTILDRLKVALVVCNKTQAVTILTSVSIYSNNSKDDIKYLTTF